MYGYGLARARMRVSTTWRNSSSRTSRRSAARLRRPGGGESPPHGLCRRVLLDGWLDDLRPVALSERQVAVGEHDERHVPGEPRPEPALVVVQAQLALGVLVEALDDPAP